MNMAQSVTVGTVIARGGQAAHAMSQENASSGAQPSAFDVWSHSYEGLADRMQSAADDPAAFLASDPAQRARVQAAALNMPQASVDQIANSMSAQTSALSASVDAVGQAQGALQTVGATFALLTGVEQLLSTALSAIPFPALPAVRIADFDIGLPHAHSHPPNLIPPAPPIPLPSMGPVIPIPILSGASTVLVNGMPAGRCGDMGIGIWCGGYFPLYEIFLGSSSVWIEGARAARLLVDITKHCMFTVPKPSDPPLGPMIGTTISCSPNVLIGGVPLPSLTALALGAAMRGAFKIAGKGAKAFSRATAPLRRRMGDMAHEVWRFVKCEILRAEPVNFVTGEVSVDQQDFILPGRISMAWARQYSSHRSRKGVCGYGWSTHADARLMLESDGAVVFHNGQGAATVFAHLPSQGIVQELVDGATLEATHDVLRVRVKNGPVYVFPTLRAEATATEVLIRQVEDRCGNSLRYVRDDSGLREIVESAGRRIEVRSESGLIREMWLRHSEHEAPQLLVRYEYSESAELIAVHDTLEHPYRFRYEHKRLVQHTDRNGLSFYYDYDSDRQSARCHHAWGDGGLYDYRFAFDPCTRRVVITDSLRAQSTVQLNELNLPIWELNPLGGITRYEYDDRGRTIAVIDADGHRTGYEYDECGNPVTLTLPGAKTLKWTYNEDHKVATITDSHGSVWQQNWDARGLLQQQITPLGHIARFEYDTHGQLIAHTNARGARTALAYDRIGNLTCITDAQGHDTRFTHDSRGNIASKIDALDRKTLYRYDAKNRLVHVRQPSGAVIACAYDPEDRLIRYVDATGAESRLEYFGQGEIARRVRPDGSSVRFHYDTEERLIGITNERGETHHYIRDALGGVIEEVDYWGQLWQFQFSAGGDIRGTVDPLGRKTRIDTDPMGRVLRKTMPHPTMPGRTFEERFEYDATGNLIATENPHIRIERKFDVEGRILEEKQGERFTLQNAYDEVGNRISRRTQLRHGARTVEHEVRYAYDSLNQAVEVAIDQQSPIRIQRNAGGEIIAEQLSPQLHRESEYDAEGFVTRKRVRAGSRDLFDVRYGYDTLGNLTQRHDSVFGVDRYLYDPIGRITQHIDPQGKLAQFLNDPAGDRLQTRLVEHERVGSYDGTSYRFDRAGNLIERHDERGELSMRWDANQRLSSSSLNGIETRYAYDPLGRRLSKSTVDETTYFAWDADKLASDSNDAGPAREWVYLPTTFEPLAVLGADSNPHSILHYHNDPNGCPTRLTDSSGTVKWAASYTAWGAIDTLHVDTVDQPIRLQGQYEDVETGHHYNRHRYFDAHSGGFISADPLGLAPGLNPYEYGRNAVSWVDPLGLACGPAVRKNSAGRWIDDRGRFAKTPPRPNYVLESYWHEQGIPGTTKGYHAHAATNPVNGVGATVSKSRFAYGEGGSSFADEVYNHPNVRAELQSGGRWKYSVDNMGRDTGLDRATPPQPVRGGEVIVEGNPPLNPTHYNAGEVVTQYPI